MIYVSEVVTIHSLLQNSLEQEINQIEARTTGGKFFFIDELQYATDAHEWTYELRVISVRRL